MDYSRYISLCWLPSIKHVTRYTRLYRHIQYTKVPGTHSRLSTLSILIHKSTQLSTHKITVDYTTECTEVYRVHRVGYSTRVSLFFWRKKITLFSPFEIFKFETMSSSSLSAAAGGISMTDERAPAVDMLDTLDPTLERTFRGHKSVVTSVTFKPDLKQIASGSSDCSVMVWNFRPQLRAYRFMGHTGSVNDVQFSPNGRLLASASADRTVRLWRPNVRGDSCVLRGHASTVRSVDFSPDGRQLLTASDDKTMKLWALPSRKFVGSFTGHNNWVRSAVFSPDGGSRVASGSDDKTVKVWDTKTRKLLHTYFENSNTVHCVRYAPGSSCLASCCEDGDINIWDTRSNQLVQHYREHNASVNSIRFHPSGNYLVSASADKCLKVMDLREGHLLYTLQGHTGSANAVGFSANGEYFASGSSDEIVMVWKTNFDRPLQVEESTESAVAKSAETSSSKSRSAVNAGPLRQRNFNKMASSKNKSLAKKSKASPRAHPLPPKAPRAPVSAAAPLAAPATGAAGESPTGPIDKKIAQTMDVVAQQLKVTLDTLAVFERRLRRNEDSIAEISATQKQIVELLQRQEASSSK